MPLPYYPIPVNAISVFNDSQQTVEQNAPVVFNRAKILSSNQNFSNQIVLNQPGTYQVTFTASGTGTVAGTTPVFQLQDSNGNNIAGAKASVNDAATTDISGISFSTIVNVAPSNFFQNNSLSLSVINTGDSALLQNSSLTIIKVGR